MATSVRLLRGTETTRGRTRFRAPKRRLSGTAVLNYFPAAELHVSDGAKFGTTNAQSAPGRQVSPGRRIFSSSATFLAALTAGFTLALCGVVQASADSFEDGVRAEVLGDRQSAVAAYRQAAEAGEASAQFALGRLYLRGSDPPQDHAQALEWFEKAATQGNPGAEYELGVMYEGGDGAKRDSVAAAGWFLKSATQGYGPAQIGLAGMFERGAGVSKDLAQAVHWATPEAQRGNVAAQLKLGTLYVEATRQILARGAGLTRVQFHLLMDKIFGPGSWRETGGYRTPARENELRAEGAGTVPVGTLSRHSLGSSGAPGAYDVVVANMSTGEAAARLLSSGMKFKQVFPEGMHGDQGPHLHVEPLSGVISTRAPTVGSSTDALIDEVLSTPGSDDLQSSASDYEHAEYWLQLAARGGSGEALTLLAKLHSNDARKWSPIAWLPGRLR
jgi:TPR repeat protein